MLAVSCRKPEPATLASAERRRMFGTISCNRSMRLLARSLGCTVSPVTLPPGCARLLARPVATGSLKAANTIGMLDVALLAMFTPLAELTMTSTLRWTNSAANSAMRSLSPAAQRYSIAMLRPSVQPSSDSRLANAATHAPCEACEPGTRKPMTGDLAGWACSASGHAAAAPPISQMNSRRSTRYPARPKLLPYRSALWRQWKRACRWQSASGGSYACAGSCLCFLSRNASATKLMPNTIE